MKKLFWGLVLGVMCVGTAALAAPGDVSGNVYATDIRASINGVQVPSYNIGGKTVVAVEEILSGDTYAYIYNDACRVLLVRELSPYSLVEGTNGQTAPVGKIVEKTYETDIKTYVYDKEVLAYNIGGKTAVAIEDLGGDNEFSSLGGKYVWNPDDRTIALEFMYGRDAKEILTQKHVKLVIDENLNAVFEPQPIYHGVVHKNFIPESNVPQAIYAQGEIIGYLFTPKCGRVVEGDNLIFEPSYMDYYYPEKIAELLADTEPVQPTVDDWKSYYKDQMYSVIDSYETEEYSFFYLYQPTPHGSSQFLQRIAKDGSRICYDREFASVSLYGTKRFDNVVIDEEKEKVIFRYDVNYEIDLKTGTMYKTGK